MKKRFFAVFIIIALIFSGCAKNEAQTEDKTQVLASFYPIYAMALAIGAGCDEIEISLLAAPETGCLHDYQLTTSDMQKLSDCDLFLINGNGMESFVENAYEQVENLNLVDTSDGVFLLESDDLGHNHEVNAHTWLYLENAVIQADAILNALIEIYPEGEEIFTSNYEAFKKDIEDLINEKEDLGLKTVFFHSGFLYLAKDFGIEALYVVDGDENIALSAREQAEIIDLIKENNIKVIFASENDSYELASSIANESGAKLIALDPITRGEGSETSFIDATRLNIETLKEAAK